MKQTKHYDCIEKGKGSLKYYRYHVRGIKTPLKSKEKVKEALALELCVFRVDKITGQVETFFYTTNSFEVMTE